MASYEKIKKGRENCWMLKAHKDDKKVMDDIRRERISKGLDKEMIPYKELFSASLRYKPLLNALKTHDIKRRDKKC
jgi:hypothetical protein